MVFKRDNKVHILIDLFGYRSIKMTNLKDFNPFGWEPIPWWHEKPKKDHSHDQDNDHESDENTYFDDDRDLLY